MTTRRMASYHHHRHHPANLTPMSMFKPMPSPRSRHDQPSSDLSVPSIQRALDQLLAEFHHKNGNKVRHFYAPATGNNQRNVNNSSSNRPRVNSYTKQEQLLQMILYPSRDQIQTRAAESSNNSWWFPPPSTSNKQSFFAQKATQLHSNPSNPLLMLPPAPVSRYSLFQTLPPVGKPAKVSKIPKVLDECPLKVPVLDRTVAPPKAKTGFQPLIIKPASSSDKKHGSNSDDSDKDFKKLPLYMRSASPKFQLIVPEARRPVTRSRSLSGRATPSKEEHDLVIKIVNGTTEEIQKIIEDFISEKYDEA